MGAYLEWGHIYNRGLFIIGAYLEWGHIWNRALFDNGGIFGIRTYK